MSNIISLSAKSLMLAGAVIFSASFMTGQASASQFGNWWWPKIHHHTETIQFPVFDGTSEGNFPSVCDGQVGYWTQIPMPGGKVFCVLHFTEFFKGGTYTDGGTTPTCTTTKSTFVWWHKLGSHSYTKDGSCPTHTWKKPPV